MIKVYLLPAIRVNGVDTVAGTEYIHNAILDVEGTEKKLIQDATPEEDFFLSTLSSMNRKATEEEETRLRDMWSEFPSYPSPRDLAAEIDELRAEINKIKKDKEVKHGLE